eukprot:gene30804-40103_t
MSLLLLLFVAVFAQCDAAANNQFHLWEGLVSPNSKKNGEVLPGFMEAISEIWTNQHPPSCKTAKYIIYESHPSGFGSEFHVAGAALATAIEEKSVFLIAEKSMVHLQNTNGNRYRNKLCSEKNSDSIECYIEPISNCTFNDVIELYESELFKHESELFKHLPISNISWTSNQDATLLKAVQVHGTVLNWENVSLYLPFGQTSKDCYLRWHNYIAKNNSISNKLLTNSSVVPYGAILHLKHNLERFKSNYVQVSTSMPNRFIVPSKFAAFLEKNSNLDKRNYYNWWRAISIAYFFRPTEDILAMINRYSNPILRAKNGRCVSTYVRHGDKYLEMKLVDFEEYANATIDLFNDKRVFPEQPRGRERLLFLATEDVYVLDSAATWGEMNNVTVVFSKLNKEILQANQTSSLQIKKEFEYFSFFLHLSEILRCDAYVGTSFSNYNRLIDELRATIGENAKGFNIDLSNTTCPRPCIRTYATPNGPYSYVRQWWRS